MPNEADVLADAVRRCREAQEEWQARSVKQRLRPVMAFRRLLVAECDTLCSAVARDVGKRTEETLGGDLLPLADACKFLEQQAARLLKPRKVSRCVRPVWLWGQRDIVHRRPRGVVGIIGTWNYPLLLNGVQILQALTAGNAVAWKPSEVAPASAAALHDMLQRSGFPDGLLHVMPATREGGSQLVEADIDHLVFTGHLATGRRIAARLGERLISSTLELSGCDAMFVLADADVQMAARAAWFGSTLNRGQTCIAVRRAFVHRSVYETFLDTLRPWASAAEPMTLSMPAQAQQAERLTQDAVVKGARLLAGTTNPRSIDGGFVPTVITEATPAMDLWSEPAFAPIMAVLPFDDITEALRQDAKCPFGLGASVFTARPWRAQEIAGKMHTGLVTINDVIAPTAHPATPFGGVKQSGWGTTQGAEGLLDMTVPQVVSIKKGTFRPHYELATAPPGSQESLLRGLLNWLHGRSFGARWRGFWQVVRAWWRGK